MKVRPGAAREAPEPARERALAGLRQLYADLDGELAALAPRCELSGRCCNFKESGLTLFATELELQWLDRTGAPAVAHDAELCPWWRDGICHARDGRPLGCRVYFCDESKAAQLEAISIRYHARLKRLHAELPYDYAPFLERAHARVRAIGTSGALTRASPRP